MVSLVYTISYKNIYLRYLQMKNAGAMPLHDLILGIFVDISLGLICGKAIILYKLFGKILV